LTPVTATMITTIFDPMVCTVSSNGGPNLIRATTLTKAQSFGYNDDFYDNDKEKFSNRQQRYTCQDAINPEDYIAMG
jgi:hypothetical protein